MTNEEFQKLVLEQFSQMNTEIKGINNRLGKLEAGQVKLEDGQEKLEAQGNKNTFLLEHIKDKLDITAEVINSNFNCNQREHEEINNSIARKVWTELARMVK